jgi:hypothetical protein
MCAFLEPPAFWIAEPNMALAEWRPSNCAVGSCQRRVEADPR